MKTYESNSLILETENDFCFKEWVSIFGLELVQNSQQTPPKYTLITELFFYLVLCTKRFINVTFMFYFLLVGGF